MIKKHCTWLRLVAKRAKFLDSYSILENSLKQSSASPVTSQLALFPISGTPNPPWIEVKFLVISYRLTLEEFKTIYIIIIHQYDYILNKDVSMSNWTFFYALTTKHHDFQTNVPAMCFYYTRISGRYDPQI